MKLKEYNALFDPNMRHYFENKKIQSHLYRSGQIDSNGRVIDIDKNKSKMIILEKEFRAAELAEQRRIQEEMEMRVSIVDDSISVITFCAVLSCPVSRTKETV